MALTANPQSALPSGPSWDETIVPSLRKRLETESRILTKRLSTISITDEGPPQASQRTAYPPHDTVDPYSQRPSAIPRPSYSSRPVASPSPPPPPPEPVRKAAPSKRQRTQSTPFPFNNSVPPAPNGHINGSMSPSPSSGSTSPRVHSPSLARGVPSRIPTVSTRARSGSQSSQGIGAKSSFPPNQKFTSPEAPPLPTYVPDTPAQSLRGKASSSSLARQRIVDERPPFTDEPSPNVLEREFTGRPSAEEERTFQHWYRGDVSRNGGVGEYRVGKRIEMLDIANYGHAFRGPGPAGRARAYEEPILRSEGLGIGLRKRAESISSLERMSIYIDPQDDGVIDRVLDETPLTDIEADETDYDQHSYAYYEPPTEFGTQQYGTRQQPHSVGQALPTNHDRGHSEDDARATLPTRLPSTKPRTRIPQALAGPRSRTGSTTGAQTPVSESFTPVKPDPRERGRLQPTTNSRSKPVAKPKSQKRSKSARDKLQSAHDQHESVDYTGLADAVPETSSPKPRDGNWDEVILPTVARRMGIEYEKEDPVSTAKRKARESRIAPAPGTFGYDYTKYKLPQADEGIPMDEFGQQRPEPALDFAAGEASPPAEQTSPLAPTSMMLRSRRETMPTTAPFSHYMTLPNSAPKPVPEPLDRGQRKERHDVPHILVHPPTMDDRAPMHVEDGENSGCCKCVVM